MKIDDYLMTDRILKDKKNHYKKIDNILPFFNSIASLDVEIIFIESLNKEIEFISFNMKDYLIIDIALYEELYSLNKIFYFSSSPEAIKSHTCKYLSERFMLLGMRDLSDKYLSEYEKNNLNNEYNEIDEILIEKCTEIQFLFLIFHEFNHYTLNNDAKKYDYLTKCIEFYKDALDYRIKGSSERNLRKELDDYSKMWKENIEKRSSEHDSRLKNEFIKEKKKYTTEYDYMEEIDCDENSANLVLGILLGIKHSKNYFNEIFAEDLTIVSTFYNSCFLLALHHLRYHLQVKRFNNHLNNVTNNYKYTFNRSQTRISLFREIIRDKYFCAQNRDGAHIIQNMFRDLNIKYQQEIDDPTYIYLFEDML